MNDFYRIKHIAEIAKKACKIREKVVILVWSVAIETEHVRGMNAWQHPVSARVAAVDIYILDNYSEPHLDFTDVASRCDFSPDSLSQTWSFMQA